ncbi:hypothetical protein [Vibrio campbellii]|uniref:hypothetical protein n=1 Tax=Vibrio campbellii TaxID=680 RepID=UPI0038CDB60D
METDIPKGFSAGFELIAAKLNSSCESASGDVLKSGFAHYWIDDEELSEGDSLHFEHFNNASALYLNDKRPFTVSFDALPNFDVSRAYCKGAATLIVSLDF